MPTPIKRSGFQSRNSSIYFSGKTSTPRLFDLSPLLLLLRLIRHSTSSASTVVPTRICEAAVFYAVFATALLWNLEILEAYIFLCLLTKRRKMFYLIATVYNWLLGQ